MFWKSDQPEWNHMIAVHCAGSKCSRGKNSISLKPNSNSWFADDQPFVPVSETISWKWREKKKSKEKKRQFQVGKESTSHIAKMRMQSKSITRCNYTMSKSGLITLTITLLFITGALANDQVNRKKTNINLHQIYPTSVMSRKRKKIYQKIASQHSFVCLWFSGFSGGPSCCVCSSRYGEERKNSLYIWEIRGGGDDIHKVMKSYE